MESTLDKQLAGVATSFSDSKTGLSLPLKMKTAELICRLMTKRKNFGLFVILGWQKKWQEHLDISDSQQDIFVGRHIDIMHATPAEDRGYDVGATVDFDGAILIDKRGVIVHSGAMIEGLRPRAVAQKLNPGHFADLSEQFGFTTKVHTRHLAAITASYIFRGTTVYTVSEENNAFHIFEGGRIIFSNI